MSELSTVRLWKELKDWYAEHLPEAVKALNPGASEEEVAEFDEELRWELGQGLPEGLRSVYLENDGQNKHTLQGMFFGLGFLSLEEMHRYWLGWFDTANDKQLDLDEDFHTNGAIYPSDSIQKVYAHTHWLPFAHDGGGNHLGIDLQPGPKGRVGQIINFGPDENTRCVVAPSFEVFLEWLLGQYRSSNYIITKDEFDGQLERLIQIRNPRREVFLDAVPMLFGPKRSAFRDP